jgi:hypothetical protein
MAKVVHPLEPWRHRFDDRRIGDRHCPFVLARHDRLRRRWTRTTRLVRRSTATSTRPND